MFEFRDPQKCFCDLLGIATYGLHTPALYRYLRSSIHLQLLYKNILVWEIFKRRLFNHICIFFQTNFKRASIYQCTKKKNVQSILFSRIFSISQCSSHFIDESTNFCVFKIRVFKNVIIVPSYSFMKVVYGRINFEIVQSLSSRNIF